MTTHSRTGAGQNISGQESLSEELTNHQPMGVASTHLRNMSSHPMGWFQKRADATGETSVKMSRFRNMSSHTMGWLQMTAKPDTAKVASWNQRSEFDHSRDGLISLPPKHVMPNGMASEVG